MGVNTLGLSVSLSLCLSHMVGVFLQNRVTLTGLLMILLSESNLTYPLCGMSYYVLLGALVLFFINMVPHCISDWVLVHLLHNACIMIIVTCYVMVGNELCECEMLCCTWDLLFWTHDQCEYLKCDFVIKFLGQVILRNEW